MRRWMLGLVAVTLIAGTPRASARSIAFPPSATSNILIWDGKVLFVQPDGAPVMLDIATGAVVHVGETSYFGQVFVAIAAGKPVIVNKARRDPSGVIQCTDFVTGHRLWQTTGDGILGVDGDHILVWHYELDETEYDPWGEPAPTVRVNLETGANGGDVELPPRPIALPDSLGISAKGVAAHETATSDGEPAYLFFLPYVGHIETYGYADAGARWIGRYQVSDPPGFGLAHMASDRYYVVTISNGGRVECLDWLTGTSKWLYMSPHPLAFRGRKDDWTQWRIDVELERDTRRSATVALPLGDQDDWRVVADKLADIDPPDVPFIRSPTWREPAISGWTVALKSGLALLLLAGIVWCVRRPIGKAKNYLQWSLVFSWAFAIAFVLRLTCDTLAPGATAITIGLQGVLAALGLLCFVRAFIRSFDMSGRSKDASWAAIALIPVLIIFTVQAHDFYSSIAIGSSWW